MREIEILSLFLIIQGKDYTQDPTLFNYIRIMFKSGNIERYSKSFIFKNIWK